MERLTRAAGEDVFLRRGLLWRDEPEIVDGLVAALAAEGVEHERVAADDVGGRVTGLRPDGRPAVWQPEAGPVLAARSLAAQHARFAAAGGHLEVGPTVAEVTVTADGVRATATDGRAWAADVAVVAPGPGAVDLLPRLGVDVPMRPRLEQVVHFGPATAEVDTDAMACWIEGPIGDDPALYAMATPGRGYKVGLDREIRSPAGDDLDRTPDEALVTATVDRVARSLGSLDPRPIDAQVCTWTLSPDNRFVIDVLDGGIVLAAGDCGEGFKFSALMGEVLADLAEGGTADADVATFGLARFADGVPDATHVLGR